MTIAEANHMHCMARNNCICSCSVAVFCCCVWLSMRLCHNVNTSANSLMDKAHARFQNCHSFYNPVSLKAAANISQHPQEAAMPVFLFPSVWWQLSEQHEALLTENIENQLSFAGSRMGIQGFYVLISNYEKCFFFRAYTVCEEEMFLIHSDGCVAHYLKCMSY